MRTQDRYGQPLGPYTSWVSGLSFYAWCGFGLGLLLGSFLNVCISRLPRHESVAWPGSRCEACGHAIRWYDNVPVLSWLVLRGRCRDCKATFSWRYPAVELGLGLWGYLAGVHAWRAWFIPGYITVARQFDFGMGLACAAVGFAVLGFLLIGLMVMDWQTQRLPDAFTLTGIAAGLFLVCVQALFLTGAQGQVVLNTTHQLRLSSPGSFAARGNVFLTGPEALVFGRLAAIVSAALLLLAIRWAYKAIRHRDGLGLGDVKMLAMIAAFLGFSESLLALLVGVLTASLYGLTLIARRKAHAATALPFGSFLAVGGLFAALWGSSVVDWYARMLR
jgi:leader peptidase (prepilin peptidase)/N-methyltransferase